jgi:hypothetical protein
MTLSPTAIAKTSSRERLITIAVGQDYTDMYIPGRNTRGARRVFGKETHGDDHDCSKRHESKRLDQEQNRA